VVEIEKAMPVWKTECAPPMIQRKGCISENFSGAVRAHELISYSEWNSEADIELYQSSEVRKQIMQHSRALQVSACTTPGRQRGDVLVRVSFTAHPVR
jgi:hypothetical protein